MAKRYDVDWEDAAFPRIVLVDPEMDDELTMTLAEAKREIIQHFQYEIDHARTIIRNTRALRAADVQECAEEFMD
ncbi:MULTISPECIES: hypothetical protein [unclassified Streptomyces]|uniref:hypothetical protein n=1 Tax=unclassified Streptomyces TaxID=2593676 RepID=UPI00089B1F64|nr:MULTISPECIES: hypothetical protein [unclassified Streptomyces]PBC84613.1 hypothetical protein BX261_4607 [Streptomyces sp. 2321.6]SED37917.1 hypothetical protein SAMN05428940_4635 [Streptomyces sp. 2133.1]